MSSHQSQTDDYDEKKLSIPFPNASSPSTHLVGILHQKRTPSSSSSSSKGGSRPLVLILHGVLAHKDQTYHRLLAKRLDVDSLRFDFRGNGESGGEWGMADYEVRFFSPQSEIWMTILRFAAGRERE